MNIKENRNFVRKTEALVRPEDVTAISFLGDFNRFLPKKIQQTMMEKGSRKIPYMGFIVEPYCFFMAYKITDVAEAQKMLPDGYEIAEARAFAKGPKYPMMILSAFTARTSAFIGTRLEYYIIARNRETGLLSWIISDYETNTNSHDPRNGFCGYSSEPTVFTTNPYGELIIEFRNSGRGKAFSITADLTKGETAELDQELWVEGNLSIDYGGELKDASSKNFSLIFDPVLMKEARRLPIDRLDIIENSYLDTIIEWEKPVCAAYFPFSQHFIIKQNMRREELRAEKDLISLINEFTGSRGYKTMKGDDLKKPIFRGMLISGLVNLGIIAVLLLILLI